MNNNYVSDYTWDSNKVIVDEKILYKDNPIATTITTNITDNTADEQQDYKKEVIIDEKILADNTVKADKNDEAKKEKADNTTTNHTANNTNNKEDNKAEEHITKEPDTKEPDTKEPQNVAEDGIDDELSFYSALYKDLRDEGIINHIDVEDADDINRERFFQLQREEYEKALDARLDAIEETLGSDGRAFIEFKRNGGKTEDFLTYLGSINIPLDGDINDEAYQDSIIKQRLNNRDWTQEEIENRLEYLQNNGKKQYVAQQYLDELRREKKAGQEQLIANARKEQLRMQQEREAYRKGLAQHLEQITSVKGLPFRKGEKTKIVDFLTRDAYETQDGRRLTEFNKRLQDVFQDPEKSILLAKLLMSDFDFSGLQRNAQTEVAKRVRGHLENRKALLRSERPTRLQDVF